ncbi:MAG: hypothetical protein PWR01_1004, partial [Clostridiales bacterium]|nr:hypothetical protein [Clostridiales bacterium]
TMKEIHVSEIIDTVARLCIEACYNVGDDVKASCPYVRIPVWLWCFLKSGRTSI